MEDPMVGWIAAIVIGGIAGWLAEPPPPRRSCVQSRRAIDEEELRPAQAAANEIVARQASVLSPPMLDGSS